MEQKIIASVFVDKLSVYATKGVFKDELFVPNQFSVSVKVYYFPKDIAENDYLDYSRIVQIIQNVFQSNVHLLEKLASKILEEIQRNWQIVNKIEINIHKHHPFFAGANLSGVGVDLKWEK